MAAKPQQMSDSQEKSDDLIAELAKLMANNAGSEDAGPKPSVIKLPPLNEATIKAAPVRIPGMDAPRPAADPVRPAPATIGAAPTVRIPGMEKPAGIDSIPAPQPRPTTQFDFGKPPAPAVVPAPEPMANWQSSMPPKLPPAPPPRPAAVAQLAEMKFDPVKPITAEPPRPAAPTVTRLEPKVSAPPASAPIPMVPPAAAARPASSDSFGFDFGFSGGSDSQPHPAPANDPIADLIAADLDTALEQDEPEAPAPAPTPTPAPALVATKPMPATVANEVLPNPIAPRPVTPVAPRPVSAPAAVQIKPVTIAPRTDGDRFTVAPVFSNPRPAPAISAPPTQPALQSPAKSRAADLDPMDEIENLIGEAVRVELSAPEKPAAPAVTFGGQPAAPVVPPLSSGFAPRRANMRDKEPQVDSAEAAILAAAAASGAEVGRVDSPMGDDRPYKRMKVKPPRTSGVPSGARQYVGIAVAGTLLLAAGFGLYWVIGMGREDPATAPVLTADAGAVKVQPAPAVAAPSAQSGSVVFDEINGTAAVDDSETLVSRDETAGTTPTEVARAVVVEPTESTENGLANRKVRTVTVRPDGTIVSGDEGVAGAEELPVDRPNVPEIPGGELAPSELLTAVTETQNAAGAAAADAADPIAALVDSTAQATATPLPDPAPLEVAAVEPVASDTPATFDASIVAPIPMPRPVSRGTGFNSGSSQQAASASNSAIAPASTPLVAVAQQPSAPVAVTSSGGSGAYVQLSSQPSEDDASRQLRATQQRMSGMLNGAQLEIRRVDLGAKGVWYRVVLPVNSFRDATQTCASIKSNGGDCVAING